MFRYYCPIEEAMVYLSNMVNEVTVAMNAEKLFESQPDLKPKLTELLAPSLELEKYLTERIPIDSPRYDFFFHCDFSVDELYYPMATPAGLLFGCRKTADCPIPTLDETAAQRKALSKEERLKLFYGDVPPLDAERWDANEERFKGEEGFFEFVNEINIPSPLKRKIIDLYRNFDSYVDELTELLRPVVDAVVEALPIYRDSLIAFNEFFDGITDLKSHMKDSFGIIIPNARRYDIYPCVLVPQLFSIKDTDFNSVVEVCLGAPFHEISALIYSGRDATRLTAMLKAISDEMRLEILHYIYSKPAFAYEIADNFGISGPTVSYHMNKLTMTGLAKGSLRSGKAFYEADIDSINAFPSLLKRYINSPYLKK